MWRLTIGLTSILIGLSFPTMADMRADAALQASQGAIGSTVPDFTFQSADGSKITLSDLRGKPLLITMIYTGCADVCPTIIESLASAAETAEEILGKDSFRIITIGFDTRHDTPERMRSFARAHSAGGENWYFVGSDSETVRRLSTAVGFNFFASAGGFSHISQVTVLDKSGAIFQQVYGSSFAPPAIVEPLKQLVLGRERSVLTLEGLGDRVKLFCTIYDPKSGRYYFDYSLPLLIIIGFVCLLGIFVFIVRELRKTRHPGGI